MTKRRKIKIRCPICNTKLKYAKDSKIWFCPKCSVFDKKIL